MKPTEAIKALEEMDAQIIDSKNRIFKRIADTIRTLESERDVQAFAARELAAVLGNAGAPVFQDSTHAYEWGNENKRKLARLEELQSEGMSPATKLERE